MNNDDWYVFSSLCWTSHNMTFVVHGDSMYMTTFLYVIHIMFSDRSAIAWGMDDCDLMKVIISLVVESILFIMWTIIYTVVKKLREIQSDSDIVVGKCWSSTDSVILWWIGVKELNYLCIRIFVQERIQRMCMIPIWCLFPFLLFLKLFLLFPVFLF